MTLCCACHHLVVAPWLFVALAPKRTRGGNRKAALRPACSCCLPSQGSVVVAFCHHVVEGIKCMQRAARRYSRDVTNAGGCSGNSSSSNLQNLTSEGSQTAHKQSCHTHPSRVPALEVLRVWPVHARHAPDQRHQAPHDDDPQAQQRRERHPARDRHAAAAVAAVRVDEHALQACGVIVIDEGGACVVWGSRCGAWGTEASAAGPFSCPLASAAAPQAPNQAPPHLPRAAALQSW